MPASAQSSPCSPTDAALRRPGPDLTIDPPGPFAPWRELRSPVDWLHLAATWRRLPNGPAPSPRTAVLLPGLGASPLSMSVLAQALRRREHTAVSWGLGRNGGNVPALLPRVVERFDDAAQRAGEPIVAIGWSLGGYLAREAARERPDLVRQLVTLGSPVVGGPSYTTVANWYRVRGYDLGSIRETVAERYATPLEVPVLALYSKRDGVVAWRACIDHWSPQVRHVEVDATHFSLGSSSEALRHVVDQVDAS
ncbi:MAG: alpha/beta fold hydrolase [Acidobacteriota bacterium]